jgi:histidyl-tRNA synthetase
MAKPQGPLSGFRDLLADQIFPRERVIETIKNVYELYGFVPLKTPALERLETLTGKYGEEGDKLIYSFKDNGGRDVAMRYDQTVPLARVMAQYGSKLPNPYKRYVIGDVWRGESPQAGRYREFSQFDADIVGSPSYLADTEIIAMMSDVMTELGLKYKIRVNDRRILDGLSKACGIKHEKDFQKLTIIIDKVEKIGEKAALKEIDDFFGKAVGKKVAEYIAIKGTNEEKLVRVSEINKNNITNEAVSSLRKIFEVLQSSGNAENVVFDLAIARGLSYYTGTIFETTLDDLTSIGSICSGGRFDSLIKKLGGPSMPAIGTSIGVDRLLEAMDQLKLIEVSKTKTKVYVTNVEDGFDKQRFNLVQWLRKNGIEAEMIYDSAKLGKQIQVADKLGVKKIIILGSQEMKRQTVAIKDLDSGEQKDVSPKELLEELNIK